MDNTAESNNRFLLPIAVVAAGLLIGGVVIWNGSHPASGTTGTQPAGTPQGQTADIKNVKIDGDPYIGSANAPVTVAFWSDFQCFFCKQFELNTLPQILENYVNTGKVKIVFLDFAVLGNDSITAGEYGRAVWKLYPDKYFAWRTAMYNAQDQEGDQGFGNAVSIDKLDATVAGIDAAKVALDVKTNGSAYQALMDADRSEGQNQGVNATPSFVIGMQMIAGAYPYPTFQQTLDKLVKS